MKKRKFKVGDTVIVLNNKTEPYLKKGEVCIIKRKNGSGIRVQSTSPNKYGDGFWWVKEENIRLATKEELLEPVSDEQTLMFWNLQLQFMDKSSRSLVDIWQGLRFGGLHFKLFAGETDVMVRKGHFKWTEEEKIHFATLLALQLSGLE
jgi:hypothetical protein